MFCLQRFATGHATYLTALENRKLVGLHWANLARTCPFPAAAIGFTDIWQRITDWLPPLAGITTKTLEWAFSALVLLVIAVPAALVWRPAKEPLSVRPAGVAFLAAAVLTTALTVAMLVYLSVRTPLDGIWTYVFERRYFAVFYAFLGLGVVWGFAWLLSLGDGRRHLLWKAPVLIVLLAWAAGGCEWRVGSLVRFARRSDWHFDAWRTNRRECRLVRTVVRRHLESGREVMFVHPRVELGWGSHGEYLDFCLALMSGAPIFPLKDLPALNWASSRPAAVLVVVSDEDGSPESKMARDFLRRQGGFVRRERLRDGWLYEALLPCAQVASAGTPPCKTR